VELEGLEGSWFGLSHNVPSSVSFKAAETQSKYAPSALKVGLIGLAIFLQPEVSIPLAVADISGAPVTSSPQGVVGSLASEASVISETKPLTTLERNVAQGAAFEKQTEEGLSAIGHTEVSSQLTVKAANGVKTKIDFASIDPNGLLVLTEAKSSSTAPLTKNQKSAFPSIAQDGGVVVGKGKPPAYASGLVIPPTNVNVVRPTYSDATYVRTPAIPLTTMDASTKKN